MKKHPRIRHEWIGVIGVRSSSSITRVNEYIQYTDAIQFTSMTGWLVDQVEQPSPVNI